MPFRCFEPTANVVKMSRDDDTHQRKIKFNPGDKTLIYWLLHWQQRV